MSEMNQDFRNWLNTYRYGNYNGYEITPATQLVSYTYVISLLVVTFRRSTRYYFAEAERQEAILAKILCILCNLTIGWWGIPWGPIWTVKETVCDLADMHSASWGDLVDKAYENPQGR